MNSLKKIVYLTFSLFCSPHQNIRAENEKEATATIEVRCIVPSTCVVELQGAQIDGDELTIGTWEKCKDCQHLKKSIKRLQIHERCNAHKSIKISKENKTTSALVIEAY